MTLTMGRSIQGPQTGFTLLEVLVALVVLGFLVIGLTHGVRAGLKMWGAQASRIGQTAELDAAARVLRTILTGMVASPSAGVNPTAVGNAEIEGGPDSLAFVGDLPDGLGASRRADIKIELHQDKLVLRWTPRLHELSTAPPPEPIETELIGGVEHLDLGYWGAPGPGQPSGWQSRWDGLGIPELVRVRLIFAEGDRRRWPDLIAAPQL